MLENKNELTHITDSEFDTAIDNTIAVLPLEEEEKNILTKIIVAPSEKELREQFDLFNINQTKKNALRIIKLQGLLDRVEDQAIKRFETKPDQISNKELMEMMQVVAGQIDRSQKFIDTLKDKPMINVKTQKNEVNININNNDSLSKDQKDNVIEAIQALLKELDKNPNPVVQEAEIVDVSDSNNLDEEKNVYKDSVSEKDNSSDDSKGEN